MRTFRSIGLVMLLLAVGATPVLACAGLIGPNGAVNLLRTTTLAAHHNGVEHYVTSFSFQGGSGKFGSIIPLPGIPTKVERGGDWTLQRLIRETQRELEEARVFGASRSANAADSVRVILETRIDALDITILEGGGTAVGRWARDNGFVLPPDAPEVLDYYASRSPIFMAARYDADAARKRGQRIGDGTPVHLTIPLQNPWVPLRILALGKKASEVVRADVYLLTDSKPFLPPIRRGMSLQYSALASPELMRDLRSDKGMEWMPTSRMWLTHLAINSAARDMTYDLAVDASGLEPIPNPFTPGMRGSVPAGLSFLAGVMLMGALARGERRRPL